MSKLLHFAYPAGEIVHCICGTTYEVGPGDGWKIIDMHPQIQPDGSRKDLPTRIEWNVPCPHCEFEKQFVFTVDDMTGPAWNVHHGQSAPAVDPTPVVPFAPTGAIPGRDSRPEDTALPANQAQPSDNPQPAVVAAIGNKAATADGEQLTDTPVEGGKSVEDELAAAASGDPDKTAEDTAGETATDDASKSKRKKS